MFEMDLTNVTDSSLCLVGYHIGVAGAKTLSLNTTLTSLNLCDN